MSVHLGAGVGGCAEGAQRAPGVVVGVLIEADRLRAAKAAARFPYAVVLNELLDVATAPQRRRKIEMIIEHRAARLGARSVLVFNTLRCASARCARRRRPDARLSTHSCDPHSGSNPFRTLKQVQASAAALSAGLLYTLNRPDNS